MDHSPPPILRMSQQVLVGHFPFVLATIAVVCAILAPTAFSWSLGVAAAAGWVTCRLAGWCRGVIVLVVGLAASINMQVRKTGEDRTRAALLARGSCEVVARVQEDAVGNERSWTAVSKLLDGDSRGSLVLWMGSGPLPVAGTKLSAKGDFRLPEPPRNPGEFDRRKWMRSLGILSAFEPVGPAVREVPGWAALAAKLRHGFALAVTHGLDDAPLEAQVIRAMVIGERPRDADAVILDFRNSGALHVFCVSGLHVAMVGGIAWLVLGRAGLGRRKVIAFLIPIMFGYAWITGYEAPAARAAWMAAVFLGAFLLRRKPDLLNALGVVLLVNVLWDGRVLYQPGVQLSYGVVAVIAMGLGPASGLFRWLAQADPYLPASERGGWRRFLDRTRQWLAGSLSVSLAAGVGSAPFTIIHFGIVTPVSLLANLVLLPLVSVILAVALFSAVVFPLAPAMSSVANQANALLARVSASLAGALAGIPGGHLITRRPDTPKLLVHDLPYGAMASVLTDKRGHAVMLDCGGRDSFRWSVLASLRHQGIEPDTVILSHPDGSHMGGGYPVWEMLPVRQAILPVSGARSRAFEAWNGRARSEGVSIHHAGDVEKISGPDGSVWHLVYAPPFESAQAMADDRVAVWRLDWSGWKFLFMADAGYRTERALLDSGVDLAADVIVAGKHRRDVSLSEEFLTAVNPQVIVGKNPSYPPEESHPTLILDTWRSLGIRFLDQEESGAVTITVDEDGSLRLTGFLIPDQPLVLARP